MSEAYGDDAEKRLAGVHYASLVSQARTEAPFVERIVDYVSRKGEPKGVDWVPAYVADAVREFWTTGDRLRFFRAITDPSLFKLEDSEPLILSAAKPIIALGAEHDAQSQERLVRLLRGYAVQKVESRSDSRREAFGLRLAAIAEQIDLRLVKSHVLLNRLAQLRPILAELPGDNTHYYEAIERLEQEVSHDSSDPARADPHFDERKPT